MYQLLFISMAILGILMLVSGIRLLIKSFNEKVIVEMPFVSKMQSFQIAREGRYSIWQKGKLFRKTPVNEFMPVITNELTGRRVELSVSLFRTQVNNMSTGRMKLFTFDAPAGSYKLELQEGTIVTGLEKALSSVIPLKSMDAASYFIQIRENKPVYMIVLGIPLVILGFGCSITGIILLATF